MQKISSLFLAGFFAFNILAYADGGKGHHGGPPKDPNCLTIYNACQSAGFVVGEANIGKGLWVDCFGPIVKGGGKPNPKATIALPTVDPKVVAACQEHKAHEKH
jgi:hypothetical protein